jgi:hypothetical protein
MSEFWVAVVFSDGKIDNNPGRILGIFEDREKAVGRYKEIFSPTQIKELTFTESDGIIQVISTKKEGLEIGRVFPLESNKITDIEI